MNLQLPSNMELFRRQLLDTRIPFIRASALAVGQTSPWASKVGGLPYWPKAVEWPCVSDGRPLAFLAQLNFAEMPHLAPFPQKGIAQFFINDDDLLGMNFDDGEKPDTFRVLFYENPVEDLTTLNSALPNVDWDEELLPHHPRECYSLSFSVEEEVAPISDYRFYQLFGADFFRQFGENEWDVMAEFEKSVRSQGHKIGGYAYFTQDDPRRPEDPMLLLFQLDSDEKMDLMWGDMGVGHFFIREKDLTARNFSRVLYDWDCL